MEDWVLFDFSILLVCLLLKTIPTVAAIIVRPILPFYEQRHLQDNFTHNLYLSRYAHETYN